jgi:hypothetical protein
LPLKYLAASSHVQSRVVVDVDNHSDDDDNDDNNDVVYSLLVYNGSVENSE